MKRFRSKFFLICLCIAVVLVLVPTVLTAMGQTDLLRAGLGTVAKPFVWCFSKVSDAVDGFVAVFTEYDQLREENESLRAELNELQNKEHDDKVLENENQWLREYLNIHVENPQPILTDATVISREADDHATVLFLNKGSVHGVKTGCPVMTKDGLLGYVAEVGLDYCKVVSLIETASSVGVYTDRTHVNGVVSGDPTLRSEGKCAMNYIESTDMDIGDKIYTSGTKGSIYPPGLLVGSVSALTTDPQTGSLQATVEPAVDFSALDEIRNVMILSAREGSS